MEKTLIIGKESNFSHHLAKLLGNAEVLSSRELAKDTACLDPYKTFKWTLILNLFQPARQLGDLSSPLSYVDRAIVQTANILEYIHIHSVSVKKIVYTSSSSVYGNNPHCKELDPPHPMNLHAALKLANEELLKKFCSLHGIDLSIARVFNMYGGDDRFSVISKIIDAARNGTPLTIVNGGSAVRDFIHIDDVVDAYVDLCTQKDIPVMNIGSGRGTSVAEILGTLARKGVTVQTLNRTADELKISTADTTLLRTLCKKRPFTDVSEYILRTLSEKTEP